MKKMLTRYLLCLNKNRILRNIIGNYFHLTFPSLDAKQLNLNNEFQKCLMSTLGPCIFSSS